MNVKSLNLLGIQGSSGRAIKVTNLPNNSGVLKKWKSKLQQNPLQLN
jgi:hypothetical protein